MFRPGPGPWNEDANQFMGERNRYSDAYGNYRGGYKPLRRPYGYSDIPPDEQYDFPPVEPNFYEFHGPPMPKRKFESNRPTSRDGANVLLQFGVPKNVVDKLPNQLLEMIEIDHCGLCALVLDNETIASSHYQSKNHKKNQDKWVSNKMDVYKINPDSMPMKARELYCELCDVHITSTVHAESHYSGRSHNAIVERRKKPKNLMLLRPGMERRTNQLINREKKFNRTKQEGNQNKQEKAASSTELVCDICKTSMTCSEQMTAHLNGKRHLAKEKSFILKQMKGETDVSQDNTSQDVYTEPEHHKQPNVKGNRSQEEDEAPNNDDVADENNWENW